MNGLLINNLFLKVGQQVEIPFIVTNIKQVEGLQMAIYLKGLEFIHLTEGRATIEHFNLKNTDKGELAISWHKTEDKSTNNRLFTLTVAAKHSGRLSELLHIKETNLLAEIYLIGESTMPIALQFLTKEKDDQLELFQNQPNPFKNQTSISFYLPEAGIINFTIKDIFFIRTMMLKFGKIKNKIRTMRSLKNWKCNFF